VFVYFLLVACGFFSLRRLLWVVCSWLPPKPVASADRIPSVLVAIPFRNEASELRELLRALTALDYPADRLEITFIDDASTDEGNAIVRAWIDNNAHANLLTLPVNAGKAGALNHALRGSQSFEVFAVFDVDVRPRPDCLKRLVAPFADPRVAAVTGYTEPRIAPRNIVSAYAALEAWTHQLVNLAAKDRLNLNPPIGGGNCAYRIDALIRAGGFPAGALSEDTAVSIALVNNGGVLRFVPTAICDHRATGSLRFFLNQRRRWSYGMAAVIGQARGAESVFVSLGYADRVAAFAVASCIAAGWIHFSWLALIAVPAAAAIGSAIARGRPTASECLLLAAAFPIMAAVDVAVSLSAIAGRRPTWAARTQEVFSSNE
jgi:cellulose synthase/poly-beta-1,6-N-acetylglucosamine synthase-like glycosyltransferase